MTTVKLPRTHARRAAVQALYQITFNNKLSLAKENLDFVIAENSSKMDSKYFSLLVDGVTSDIVNLDNELSDAVDRHLSTIDPV